VFSNPLNQRSLFIAIELVFSFAIAFMLLFSWRLFQNPDEKSTWPNRLVYFVFFAISLATRWLVEPTMLTWYSDVLPFSGDAVWARFGPGTFVFQSALRRLFHWSDV